MSQPTELERAFQIARAGTVASHDDLLTELRREGFTGYHLQGRVLREQLRALYQPKGYVSAPPRKRARPPTSPRRRMVELLCDPN